MNIFPRTHWTTYMENGRRYFEIWKQWGRKCYRRARFDIGAA